ncbi:MAG TPA: prolipoprotein diacylglyceryl transferase [Natronincola sp.]|nr:prolipoprotein diacylglyceryl transferase [Natronincola sp.]
MENILFFFANLPVYTYGFMIALGLLLGTILAQQEGKRKGFGAEFIYNFIIQVALVFILVGRLASVTQVLGWRLFISPWNIFTSAHLDETRGILAVGVYIVYFIVRHVKQPAVFLDALVPSVALMQSLAYLGSSVLGSETTSFLGVKLGDFMLHPLPLYSGLAYYTIFSILWISRRNLRYDGQILMSYLALSALARRLLMPFQEVFGESTNPWLYAFATLLFGFIWFYLLVESPLTDSRRRRNWTNWRFWILYFISLVGVGAVMVKFFYWRFS